MKLAIKYIFYLNFLAICTSLLINKSIYCESENTSQTCCTICNDKCNGSCNDCFTCPNDSCFNCNSTDCDGSCTGNLGELDCSYDMIKTHVHPRSQGANTAREIVGWQWELNRPFMCENYGVIYIASEYQQTFEPDRISNQLFGGCKLEFSGSKVPNRNASKQLLADNFGLSQDFIGSVTFAPKMRNYIIDFGYYQGLDCWFQGAYLRVHAPLVFTEWELCGSECTDFTSPCFVPCYMESSDTPVATIPCIEEALLGCTNFGDMQSPWQAGRIQFCESKKIGLADIDLIFGYNFCNNDCAHFGLYLQTVLPTGNLPQDQFLFSPVVGNGKHFEVGGGVSSHVVLWGGEYQNLAVFLEGNITTLIKNKQCRIFDFCDNGPFSRYMLLKEYCDDGAGYYYDGNIVSATNITNRLVNVKLNIKGDASIKLAYRNCGFGFDLGYNIYGHSKESIEIIDCGSNNTSFLYAPKGNDGVCCSCYPIIEVSDEQQTLKLLPNDTTLSLGTQVLEGCDQLSDNTVKTFLTVNNAAQPDATAFKPGTSNEAEVLEEASNYTFANDPNQLCNICLNYDSPQVTNTDGVIIGTLNPLTSVPEAINNLQNECFVYCNSAAPAKFICADDINISSAEADSLLTQKIFTHIDYTWYDYRGYNPNIGIGGEVEFDGKDVCHKFNDHTPDRLPTNIYQWGVWIKGGFSF